MLILNSDRTYGSTSSSSIPGPTASIIKHHPLPFYQRFLCKRRPLSPIRGLAPLELRPGMISTLSGSPNPATFPITSLSFTASGPSGGTHERLDVDPVALAKGLQYGPISGYPPFVEWLVSLQEKEHRRGRSEGWKVNVGIGSQDLIYKAIVELVNSGDSILLESPTYAAVIPMFKGLDCDCINIPTDGEGIQSNILRQALESWPATKPKPKILYTIPYGCNPTGMTTSLERRKEVLRLAEEHNFLILEDDPYYYLYYGTNHRAPSYFSLERDMLPIVGRVLRFDSFSKILSSGIRIGFATGPAPLIDAIDANTASTNIQAPGLTSVIAHTLLESWGYEGFKAHTTRISEFYRQKRDVFVAAMERYLGGLAHWSIPEAGMFLWFKLSISSDDSESLIRGEALKRGVLALPGTVFFSDGQSTSYVRMSFSLLDEDQVDVACRRLAETLKAVGGPCRPFQHSEFACV